MDMQPVNIHTPDEKETSSLERVEFQRQYERYDITSFTEESNPLGALRAQQIQGESYVDAGFVFQSALDDYGRLQPELDRSRGDNVEYYLAVGKNGGVEREDEASLRVVRIPEGGSLDDLAAYRYSKDTISPEHEYQLREMIATHGTDSVREIAALSKTNKAPSIASFEVIREIVQQAIRKDTKEKWLITFASSAYFAMYENFGEHSVEQIGDPVPVDVGDPRTSDSLRLIPSLITPCEVPDQIVASMEETPLDQPQFEKLVRSLFFITDGLDESELSPKVQDCMTLLKAAMPKGA